MSNPIYDKQAAESAPAYPAIFLVHSPEFQGFASSNTLHFNL